MGIRCYDKWRLVMKRIIKNWGEVVAGSKTRWATIFIWILLIGILSYIWPQVNSQETTNKQLLPEDSNSVVATDIENKEFSDDAGKPLLPVWNRQAGLNTDDMEAIQQL